MTGSRRFEVGLALALSVTIAGAIAGKRAEHQARAAARSPSPPPVPDPSPPPVPDPPPPAAPAPLPPPQPRADRGLDLEARTAFSGGYLALTPDFASAEGIYDLVVHFHGNTELVEQSLAHARINAVFVPQNLGIGSGVYQTRFSDDRAFPDLLARVQASMEKRGLRSARLGRLALVAWSAGYGAVQRILARPDLAERVDAVLLLDCLHLPLGPDRRRPDLGELAPWERFGRSAVEGRKLLTITHSDIAPDAYFGARDTTDLLLRRLGVLRYAAGEMAEIPDIPAVLGTLPKRKRYPLSPLTLADRGKLTVRGYAGAEAEHHVQHLMQMASIALPDLAAWWARPREGSP